MIKAGDLVWVEGMGGQAKVMAVSGRYAMLRFKGCYPFVKNVKELYSQLDLNTPIAER